MIIDFQNVTYQIPSGETIYKDLDLKLSKHQYFGVLGQNGAGKSTLIEMIMGTRKLTNGTIKVFGEDTSCAQRKFKNKIFVVSHDFSVPGSIKAKNLWAYYRFFYPNYSIEIENKLSDLFEIDSNKKFGSLSTGQKVKALLIPAFAAQASLYLFDEVTAVLDPKSRKRFFKFLKEFKTINECTIFMATNISEDIECSMDKVLFIDDTRDILIKDVENINLLFEEDVPA